MQKENKDEFLSVAAGFDSAMLVTHGSHDELQARPMMIAKLEESGNLWFASDRDSGKIEEILARPHVCVTMAGGGNFVAICGVGEIVVDPDRVEQLWSEAWRVWFPEGPHDPRIALIQVHAQEAEYWSNSGSSRIQYLFEAATAYLRGKRPKGLSSSQHSHLKL
jgi:general stress protein 26